MARSEFKLEAVRQIVDAGRKPTEVARSFGIDRSLLTSWAQGGLLREALELRFDLIREHRKTFEVGQMCKLLGVSRSGFYTWLGREESARAKANRELLPEIREVHKESRETYGAPRIHAELRRAKPVGKNRVARLLAGSVPATSRPRRPSGRASWPPPGVRSRLGGPGAPARFAASPSTVEAAAEPATPYLAPLNVESTLSAAERGLGGTRADRLPRVN